MLRDIFTWLLTAAIITNPCIAQVAPERAAAQENRDLMRTAKLFSENIKRAEHAGNQRLAAETAIRLGHLYEQPNTYDHKPLDPDAARKWYAYAAAKGASNAGYWLGQMYWDGRGGPQDKDKAKYIWMWAAENKDGQAALRLRQLDYDMRKERELALSKARNYQSQQGRTDPNQKAQEGLAILFGLLLLNALVQDECEPYRRCLFESGCSLPPQNAALRYETTKAATIPCMDKLASIVQQLQQERARMDAALQALTGVSNHRGADGAARTGRRTLSTAARKRIAAAQRARWAKYKATKAGKAKA